LSRKITIKRLKEGKYNFKPNKSELFLLEILNQLYPKQWKYTGDRSLWIGYQNPDFTQKKHKKVIELFGEYWHNLENRPTEKQKKNRFKKYGYKCLVIWHDKDKLWTEPENVANKIIDWNKN